MDIRDIEKRLTALVFVGYFIAFPPYISQVSYKDHVGEKIYRLNRQQFLNDLEEYKLVERMKDKMGKSTRTFGENFRPSEMD